MGWNIVGLDFCHVQAQEHVETQSGLKKGSQQSARSYISNVYNRTVQDQQSCNPPGRTSATCTTAPYRTSRARRTGTNEALHELRVGQPCGT